MLGAAAALTLCPPRANATMLDPAFSEATFVSTGLSQVTGMEWAPDGTHRLFLIRKGGEVRIVEDGAVLPTPFFTFAPVFTSSECGLIGMAFDPSFAVNGHVYFFVTVSSTEQRIYRLTASGNSGTAQTTIVPGLPTRGVNHDGGAVGFGPDGKLYWAIGDLGNFTGVDADLVSLAAKVGRAHRDGTTPNDNPFFDGGGPNDDRIWARGLRNPYTFTFQPSTGALWVNSVGTSYEQVFVVRRGDHAGYNDYENNQPAGFITPVVVYRTNNTDSRQIAGAGATRSGGTATFTTNVAHGFRLGGHVTVAGVTNTSFNGTGYVTAVPTPTQFSIAQAGPNATSGFGTATTLNIGGAITGGTFLDSSAVPAAYRGNFFFSDYNSGRIERVTLGAGNVVTSVDHWASAFTNPIDLDVGPDGALYYVNFAGLVRRAALAAPTQGLIVSRSNLRTDEGGAIGFFVSLATAPAGTVSVNVARASGDPDVTVTQGAALSFDSTNWNAPRPVRVAAAHDLDSTDDLARLDVSSAGFATESVTVRVTDDDPLSIVLSTTAVTMNEGATAGFEVSLSGPPSGSVTVDVARSSGSTDVTVSAGTQHTFGAGDWSTPRSVTVSAAQDADTVDDVAVVSATASGLAGRDVNVTVLDDDARAPSITSTAVLTAVVGAPYAYDVEATGLPAPTFSLDAAPSGMTIAGATGVIAWTPTMTGPANVTVRAANGVSPDATQPFVVTVSADGAPTCVLTAPAPDSVVSGSLSEFFGDVSDDVGATRAEFRIDGVLAYTDVNAGGHYHLGGAHNLFDTTLLADGPHVLRMTGFDTSGQTCFAEVNVTVANGSTDGGAGSGGAAGAGASGAAGFAGSSAGAGGVAGSAASAGAGGVGVAGAGGRAGAGGNAATGGTGATAATGGTGASAGTGPIVDAGSDAGAPRASSAGDDSGCGCRAAGSKRGSSAWVLLAASLLAGRRRRRPPAS